MKIQLLHKQIEEMDSRIVERVSRTEENGIDRVVKSAKANEANSRAELYKEQADALAADFVKDATGQKRAEYELDREYDAAVKQSIKEPSKVR